MQQEKRKHQSKGPKVSFEPYRSKRVIVQKIPFYNVEKLIEKALAQE